MQDNPHFKIVDSVSDLAPTQWDELVPNDYPFLKHAFLSALENCGCLGERTGWFPRHMTAVDPRGRLLGAVPCYLKTNSYGEYVFDWSWAGAFERHGIAYYPKFVCAIPFTPATGPRVLVAGKGDDGEFSAALVDAVVAEAVRLRVSGVHWLFVDKDQAERMRGQAHLIRLGCQFHWSNSGYQSFDDYLGCLSAKKRKNIRHERRRVAQSGLKIDTFPGTELTEADWSGVHSLYAGNANRRGGYPYFTEEFFQTIGQTMPNQTLVTIARDGKRRVGAAICLRSMTDLFGRHWGAADRYDSLHFEVCYYRGIEYCIQHGLTRFDPGAQGEHKLSRGFLPTLTYSAHWLAHAGFRGAVADFLERESPAVESYARELAEHSPYRSDSSVPNAS